MTCRCSGRVSPGSLCPRGCGRSSPSCELLLSGEICPEIQAVFNLSCFRARGTAAGPASVGYFYL